MISFFHRALVAMCFVVMCSSLAFAAPAPTAFTYQGRLAENGQAFTGTASISFRLFSGPTGGSAQMSLPAADVQVQDGLFTATPDFGATAFRNGVAGYVEAVIIKDGAETPLAPRQLVTPAPLALGVVGMSLSIKDQLDIDQTTYAAEIPTSLDTSYQSFTAGRSGVLSSITFRARAFAASSQMVATLRAGVGTSGAVLGSAVSAAQGQAFTPIVLDFSTQNITLVSGQTYTVQFTFAGIITFANGVAGTSGMFQGVSANFWFQTRTISTVVPSSAGSLDALSRAALNDQELGMRTTADRAHGLGWFGGTSAFRNTGVAPDGPVLWGNGGGALGTSSVDASAGTVALRWNSSGQVGIGTSPSSNSYRLELPNTAGAAGQGRANAWVTYSSRDFKQNIRAVDNPIGLLDQLRGVRFDWKQTDDQGNHTHDIGFIAEEVAAVLPELVNHDSDGRALGLDYGRIVPVAVEAIKQQARTIQQQTLKISEQRAELDALKARLDRLEDALRGKTPTTTPN